MCIVHLSNIINDSADLPKAGDALYQIITDSINGSDKVVIDMTDVIALPSIFLNVSLGMLIDKWGKQKVKEVVSFKNVSKQQAFRIKEYFDRY